MNKEIGFVSNCQYNLSSTSLYLQVLPGDYGNNIYFYTSSSKLSIVRISSDPNYIIWLLNNSHLLLSMLEHGHQWYNENKKSLQPIDSNIKNRLFDEFKYYLEEIKNLTN